MSHTKEPWATHEGDDDVIVSATDPHVSLLSVKDGTFGCFWNAEDARRIVACVNACAGIPTDDLEASPKLGLLHLAEFANDLVKQRDDLLESAEEIKSWLELGDHESPMYSRLCDAIASVKAGAT